MGEVVPLNIKVVLQAEWRKKFNDLRLYNFTVMSSVLISKSTFLYLKKLSQNNNRDWFSDHKELYLQAKENAFAGAATQVGGGDFKLRYVRHSRSS